MKLLSGIFFHVDSLDTDFLLYSVSCLDFNVPVIADGKIVLCDLVVLRCIRIEIVLSVEPVEPVDAAVECQPCLDGLIDHFKVYPWKSTRKPQAHRTDMGIGLAAVLGGAAAEGFCLC